MLYVKVEQQFHGDQRTQDADGPYKVDKFEKSDSEDRASIR